MSESGDRRSATGAGTSRARPELNISLEKVCFVIAKARELDVKVAPEELDDASDEDMMQRILEDYEDDPTFEELQSFLRDQNDDEHLSRHWNPPSSRRLLSDSSLSEARTRQTLG